MTGFVHSSFNTNEKFLKKTSKVQIVSHSTIFFFCWQPVKVVEEKEKEKEKRRKRNVNERERERESQK